MEPTELLKNLRADPAVAAVLDAATPFLAPLGRMAWSEVQMVFANLNGRKYADAQLALMRNCNSWEEICAIQKHGTQKALAAALDEYAKTKAAKEMLLKLVVAVALAAIV